MEFKQSFLANFRSWDMFPIRNCKYSQKNSVTYKALRSNVQSRDYNGIKPTNISMPPQKK